LALSFLERENLSKIEICWRFYIKKSVWSSEELRLGGIRKKIDIVFKIC